MITIKTTDFTLLGNIFNLLLANSINTDEYLHIESMYIEPLGKNTFSYSVSMFLKPLCELHSDDTRYDYQKKQ